MRPDDVHSDVETTRRSLLDQEVAHVPEVFQLAEVGKAEEARNKVYVLAAAGLAHLPMCQWTLHEERSPYARHASESKIPATARRRSVRNLRHPHLSWISAPDRMWQVSSCIARRILTFERAQLSRR